MVVTIKMYPQTHRSSISQLFHNILSIHLSDDLYPGIYISPQSHQLKEQIKHVFYVSTIN